MNKMMIGAAVGLAAGYAVAKMKEEGYFDKLSQDVNDMAGKAKRKAKYAWDKGANEMECMRGQVENTMEKGKDKLDQVME